MLPPIPAPTSSPLLEWGLVLGGAGYFGKWALEQFSKKEQGESDMMKSLIVSQQNVLNQLIEDSRKSKAELIEQINLKDSVTKSLTQIQTEVIRALQSQTQIYAHSIENQAKIQQSLDSLVDSTNQLNQAMVQLINISPPCPHEAKLK